MSKVYPNNFPIAYNNKAYALIKSFFIITFFKNPDAQLMPSDLEAWEKKHGKIPNDVILLVFTNWGRHWPDKKKYLGTDTDDISMLHFPGMEMRTEKTLGFLWKSEEGWGHFAFWPLVGA